ncbi:hypothetical protein Q5530_04565 [Saccharothrix sp. BKS2]|uniref:hypothetical protein n=1 Tax=Saccharothrix sp. BKS2 TaxID=3064400 RepID=UPI0039E9801C
MPNKPSTEGAALEDPWTRHCLETSGRRAFGWVVLAVLAFLLHLVLVLARGSSSSLPVVLLAFSAAVLAPALTRGRSCADLLGDRAWVYARVHWRGGRLVVHGPRPLVLDVDAGPLARGRIGRHRRAWVVTPDRTGATAVTFRGVPRLFPAKVSRG